MKAIASWIQMDTLWCCGSVAACKYNTIYYKLYNTKHVGAVNPLLASTITVQNWFLCKLMASLCFRIVMHTYDLVLLRTQWLVHRG